MSDVEARASLRFDGPLDLAATLRPLGTPFGDPTLRATDTEAVRTTRTPDGPATLHVAIAAPGLVEARAFGPGAPWILARAADLLGVSTWGQTPNVNFPALPPTCDRRATSTWGLTPDVNLRVRELGRRASRLRLARSQRVFELLVPIVLEQLVSGAEASRAFARLVRRFSEPAPGPFDDLWLPLGAAEIRAIPLAAFPACGALPRQGRTLHELARRATRVEEAAAMDVADADRRLLAFPGVGLWTARSAMLRGLGFADAVPLGDYHLPRIVALNLTGHDEPHADDARMLELLEPWRGERGRLVAWIATAGAMPARRGPRGAMREIDASGAALLRTVR